MDAGILESFFLIFFGAALLATVALYTRQPLIVAYIIIGCMFGPNALGWVADADLLLEIAEIGIIFLLFLVGLDLPPNKLKNMLGQSVLTALVSSVVFFAVGFGVLAGFGYTIAEAMIGGIAAMFSSTIMGIKLLPTTVLHHRHIGEIVVSLLLIQDLIAIIALLVLAGYSAGSGDTIGNLVMLVVALPVLVAGSFLAVRFLVVPLIQRFDAFHEFIFLLAIGWCLAIASVAHAAGLSYPIGAFISGVALANSPIAQYIAESLRPLRDFFLILFFFSVGAAIDPALLLEVLLPTAFLAIALVALKPAVFRGLLHWRGERKRDAWEVGYRLGQASEFSLLVTYVAGSTALLSEAAAHVIQGATVITLLLSTYLVILRYPSPIAVSAELRRD